ncbi:MAG: MFS transporter [Candidatus Omnitrophota bacterium]|nr:MFS transporter [Candidatus Omnitrophota bacterium]
MRDREIKIFYLLSFLGGFSFNIIAPLFVVFGLSLGFSIARVGLLFGISRLSSFIFEIPTGIFADYRGRKKSVLLCYFLTIFSALIYFLSSNFYFLLIGSIISGLALAFMSGAFEALAVDSLGLSDKEDIRNKIFIRIGIITTLGFIIGGFASSAVAYFNLKYIWLLQGIVATLALFLGQKLLEEKFYPQETPIKQNNVFRTVFAKIKDPLISVLRDRRIYFMFLVAILIAIGGAFYGISWPIVLKDILSIPVYYFGIISALAGGFFLLGSLIAEKVSFKKGTIRTLSFSLALMGVFYIIFGLSRSLVLSLLSFVLIDFFNGGFAPLFYSLINRFIPSSRRATMLSFYSLSTGVSSGMGEILGGTLLVLIIAPSVVLLSAGLILIALISFLVIKNKLRI